MLLWIISGKANFKGQLSQDILLLRISTVMSLTTWQNQLHLYALCFFSVTDDSKFCRIQSHSSENNEWMNYSQKAYEFSKKSELKVLFRTNMLLASPDKLSTEEGLKMSGNRRTPVTWLSRHLRMVSAMCSQCEGQRWSEYVLLFIKKWSRDKQKEVFQYWTSHGSCLPSQHTSTAAFKHFSLQLRAKDTILCDSLIYLIALCLPVTQLSIHKPTHSPNHIYIHVPCHTETYARRDILNWFWDPVFESQTQCLLTIKSLPLLDCLVFRHFSFPLWKFCCAFCR